MTCHEWLTSASSKLKKAGIGTPKLDAEVLLSDFLQVSRAHLLAHPENKLTSAQISKLDSQIKRRAKHEPLAYIRGKVEFYGREFLVDEHVLVPRPESETMIDLLKQIIDHAQSERSDGVQGSQENRVNRIDDTKNETRTQLTQQSAESTSGVSGSARKQAGAALTIVDVGTGSGALAITAKLEIPDAEVMATDIDSKCLEVTRKNIKKHQSPNITLVQADLLTPQKHFQKPHTRGKNESVLLCNLPYVPDDFGVNKAALREPHQAIFGGKDGLDLYRKLFRQIGELQTKPKFVLTESLPPQHQKLAIVVKKHGYKLNQSEDFIQVFSRS